MTGIECLREVVRELGRFSFCYDLYETLGNIADQIEREQDAMVADSPYDALPPDERDAIVWVRDHGGLDAVKAHWEGYVPASWLEKAKSRYERKRDNLKAHAWDLERKCAERRERIRELERNLAKSASDQLKADSALYDLSREVRDVCKAHGIDPGEDPLGALDDALDSRLMPEDMEWPKYESGKFVKFGDELEHKEQGHRFKVDCVEFMADGWRACYESGGVRDVYHPGERVKRPTQKVLDADGAEIRVGDTVWATNGHGPFEVTRIVNADRLRVICDDEKNGHLNVYPESITHRAPVLAADGKPLREGETVWYRDHIDPLEVRGISTTESGAQYVKAYNDYEGEVSAPAEDFTHERPVVDTWERLEEDADALAEAEINGEGSYNAANDYCTRHGLKDGTVWVLVALDIVRRARALAERG